MDVSSDLILREFQNFNYSIGFTNACLVLIISFVVLALIYKVVNYFIGEL